LPKQKPVANQKDGISLASVIKLLKLFGLTDEYIYDRLTCADSVHNAFEGLKLEATVAHDTMNTESKQRLADALETLTTLTLKSVTRESDIRERMIDNMLHLFDSVWGRKMISSYIDTLEEHAKETQEKSLLGFLARLKRK
jgi:hypothetical protein